MSSFSSSEDEEHPLDKEEALRQHNRHFLKRQNVGVVPYGCERLGQQGQKLAQRVYTQIRCLDHAIEHVRATKIAWEFVASTSLIVQALNTSGSHVLSELVAPYNSFQASKNGQVVRQAREHWHNYECHAFYKQLERDEGRALEQLLQKFIAATRYRGSSETRWLSIHILRDYRRVLDYSFEPIELPSTASQDDVFRLCAALTPEGQLIAENLKEIQAFVRIIAKRNNLENPEAFSNWIKANHAGVAKPFQRVEGFDTSDEGILLGWTAPICRLFLRSEEKPAHHLMNPKSLSHNRYFPQSRSLPSSL